MEDDLKHLLSLMYELKSPEDFVLFRKLFNENKIYFFEKAHYFNFEAQERITRILREEMKRGLNSIIIKKQKVRNYLIGHNRYSSILVLHTVQPFPKYIMSNITCNSATYFLQATLKALNNPNNKLSYEI